MNDERWWELIVNAWQGSQDDFVTRLQTQTRHLTESQAGDFGGWLNEKVLNLVASVSDCVTDSLLDDAAFAVSQGRDYYDRALRTGEWVEGDDGTGEDFLMLFFDEDAMSDEPLEEGYQGPDAVHVQTIGRIIDLAGVEDRPEWRRTMVAISRELSGHQQIWDEWWKPAGPHWLVVYIETHSSNDHGELKAGWQKFKNNCEFTYLAGPQTRASEPEQAWHDFAAAMSEVAQHFGLGPPPLQSFGGDWEAIFRKLEEHMALIKFEEEDLSFDPMRPWWDEIAKASQTTGGDRLDAVRKLIDGLTGIELDDMEEWLHEQLDTLVESSGAYDEDTAYDDAAFVILQGRDFWEGALRTRGWIAGDDGSGEAFLDLINERQEAAHG